MMVRFAEIGATKQVKTAINRALCMSFPVCVTSAPGMGKTTALLEETKKHDYAFIEANQAMNSLQGLYKNIISEYGFWSEKSYAHELHSILASNFSYRFPRGERPNLLIVDEFQTLSLTLQRELLSLQEKFSIPLILSGNPERLANSKSDKNAYEQIKSRIGPIINIFPPSKKDCELLGSKYSLDDMDAYRALIKFGEDKSVREICRLLDEASYICSDSTIKLRHIEMAARSLYGSGFKIHQPNSRTREKSA